MSSIAYSIMLVSIAVYMLAIVLHMIRLLLGPTISDRVLAVDCIAYSSIAILVVLSVLLQFQFLLFIALFLAMFTYILDITISKYLEERVD